MSTYEQRLDAARVFSVQEAHGLVRDLMVPRMRLYWIDLTVSAVLGWTAVAAVVVAGPLSVVGALACLVAVLALYRAAVFIHELVHFRSKVAFRRFGRAWNLLVGIPLLIPYFMYEGHSEHHSKKLYATQFDAEYLAFARLSRWEIVKVLAGTPLMPAFGPLRFGILTPLAWMSPGIRAFVYARASTLKIDLEYRGKPPRSAEQRRAWMRQEAACFVVVWSAVALFVTGWLSLEVLTAWYAVFVGIAGLNTLRLLGAHRYLGNDSEANIVLQMIDTINYPASRVAGTLWGPVGLRFHALHHLLPSMPYHSFRQAHTRLVTALPPDSAYRLTEATGLTSALIALWRAPRVAPEASGALGPGRFSDRSSATREPSQAGS